MNSKDKAQARTALLLVKGAVSEMPKAAQDDVAEYAQQIRDIVAQDANLAAVAVLMVTLELQASED